MYHYVHVRWYVVVCIGHLRGCPSHILSCPLERLMPEAATLTQRGSVQSELQGAKRLSLSQSACARLSLSLAGAYAMRRDT